MWIEFTGQPELVDYLSEEVFLLFDTEYFFWGVPTDDSRRLFDVSNEEVRLTTEQTTWTGFKRTRWKDFEREFHEYKREHRLGWTDLACVHRDRLGEFAAALRYV